MQRSTPCTELWNIRHKEKEKESRKIVQGKAENKKKKKKSPFTVYRDGKNITTIALENINVGWIKWQIVNSMPVIISNNCFSFMQIKMEINILSRGLYEV